MEQPSLLEATNQVLVCAAPIVVEGLRGIGCDVVASTGFAMQLPQLVIRYAPDVIVLQLDPHAIDDAVDVVQRIRHRTQLTRIVVLVPQSVAVRARAGFDALACELAAQESDAEALRALLGVVLVQPTVALTAREVSVLQLAALGLTNRRIGARLGLRENTIKNYLKHVHEKLDVHSRTEAVMAAARAGYAVLPTQ